MKKIIPFLIILVLAALAIYLVATKEPAITTFEECVSAGYPILESYPRQCKTPDGRTFTEEIDKTDLIRVSSLEPNQTIQSPLIIQGEARGVWFFEADFPVKLYDGNGNIIAQGIAQALGDWMTEDFVGFRCELEFETPETETGQLILEKDNPSGLPENADQLIIPVVFDLEKITVKAFFNNSQLDPEFSCNKVFSAEREIPKTQSVARAALEELLKGPTEQEKEQGFLTNINEGVEIQSLVIEEGTAMVDFNEQLEYQVGGSCRVAAIRAEITETLKQFETVSDVIISINGRTEDILQP